MEKWYIYYKKKTRTATTDKKVIYLFKKKTRKATTDKWCWKDSDCQRKTLLKVYKTNIVSFKLYFIYN